MKNSNILQATPGVPAKLSDETLFHLCKKYGLQAIEARRKFAGLLLEVNRRRLFLKKGFGSIFEFAAKLAGMSEEQVRLSLNLEKRLKDTPVLHSLLVNGEVSVNKLARVASIATPDNQNLVAEQVQLLSQSAVETFVRDEKSLRAQIQPQLSVQFGNSVLQQTLRPSTLASFNLNLAPDVATELKELQHKGIDINELLREFLQKRKLEIAQEKERLAQKEGKKLQMQKQHKPSRYISAPIKKLLQKEHGTKCAIVSCKKLSEHIHHTQRFAIGQNHNPHFLAPLCREHHQIAHSIDQKYQNMRSHR